MVIALKKASARTFSNIVHPDERAATIKLFQSVVTGKLSYCHHEGRYRSAKGGYRWIELRANVSYDESGEMVGNSGTLFDITDRHEAQEFLKDEVAILELIAQDAPLHETMGSLAGLLADHSGMTVTAVTYPQAQRRSAGRRPGAMPSSGLVPAHASCPATGPSPLLGRMEALRARLQRALQARRS